MGDYYSLRFTAALAPEGEAIVRKVLNVCTWAGCTAENHPGVPHSILAYAEMPRADFIPFGALSGAPDDWKQAREITEVAGVPTWHVCCSIKVGTASTVYYFLRRVLPELISLSAKVEWWDELTNRTTIYQVRPSVELIETPQTSTP